MYTISTNQNTIIRDIDGASIPFADGNIDYGDYLTWLAAGNTPTPLPVPPVPTLADTIKSYTDAVDAFIEETALKGGDYKSSDRLAGYVSDPYLPFSADALNFITWRSQIWQRCYSDLAYIQAGSMALPSSPQDYIASLPQKPLGW